VSPLSVDPNRISESVGHWRIIVRVRFLRIAFLFACVMSLALPLAAQSPNGSMNGRVLDPSNRVISGADVLVINDATGVKYPGKTNDDGIYVVPNLPPGSYRLQVSKVGFKTLIKPDIVLNIQDALSINFTLPIGAVFDAVTVEGGASMINTTDASVSTVVDQTYVKNMPLNGRSFQDLILLTPGIVTNSPQLTAPVGQTGEFSVNGQRTDANYYTVDGVSANVGGATGVNMFVGPAASGALPASTALGTTQALVSVDDLQEFRVQSSTYSAEYGRNPGGQFSFETKSGTNQWHGTAYDYLRNGVFDAQDWFNDYFRTPEPALRQNDFGGTFGGPLQIVPVNAGKDKTFFFVSYEGLRLVAPQAATINFVPDAALRLSAPTGLQQALNAFPIQTPGGIDNIANGIAQFIGGWSNPSSLDSFSVRFDHAVSDRLRIFFRFSDTSSSSASRGTSGNSPSMKTTNSYGFRTYTTGASGILTTRLNNDFRLNYSSNAVSNGIAIDAFGGSTPADLVSLSGLGTGSESGIALIYGPYYLALFQQQIMASQQQWNLIDTVSLPLGRHQIKFGVDYRRLAPFAIPPNPAAVYVYFSEAAVQANSAFGIISNSAPLYPLYSNYSSFIQDEWRFSQRLHLSLGLRWDLNPPPGVRQGLMPYTVQGTGPNNWALAPQGTPLWHTAWYNVAPRLSAAYVINESAGKETVLRGGGGVFFDTGQQNGSIGYSGPGLSSGAFPTISFPGNPGALIPPIVNPPLPPYSLSPYGFASHLQLPYTLQWNTSLEQALGKSQALTISYVGAHGVRLLKENAISTPGNPNAGQFIFIENGLTSDYHALQGQFRRRFSRGLTGLASYTWSHCIDYGSQNVNYGYKRGNCDFDVRHNVSAAFSYDLPDVGNDAFAKTVLRHWGLDDRFTARTAFPVTLQGNALIQPNGQTYYAGLDLIPGQPVYLYGSNCATVLQGLQDLNPGQECPGGRAINPNAFVAVNSGLGNAPRNFARGFNAWQMDFSVRREFRIYDRLKLQFRAETFNVFNHPDFGSISTTGSTFGQATATLASSVGVLSPLYQMGGPRSMQFALKLLF
jgi:hypothetical protein